MTSTTRSRERMLRHNLNDIKVIDLFWPVTQLAAHEEQIESTGKMPLEVAPLCAIVNERNGMSVR